MALTEQQIQNAERDLNDLGAIINGDANTIVNTRTGGPVWSVQKVLAGMQAGSPVNNEAYGIAWNGALDAPSRNAVFDKIETIIAALGSPEDDAYGATWNADQSAATKNAIYDGMEALRAYAEADVDAAIGVMLNGAIFTNDVMIGNTTAAGTATPRRLSMGGTFSNVAGANPKLRLFWDGALAYGFGVSNAQLDYMAPTGADHAFYIDGVKVFEIGTTAASIIVGGVAKALATREPVKQTVATAVTVTPTFAQDFVTVTALTSAVDFANPTGTAIDGHGIVLRIYSAAARAITWGSQYRPMGAALKTTTVAGKTLYVPMIYNAADGKWDVGPAWQEA